MKPGAAASIHRVITLDCSLFDHRWSKIVKESIEIVLTEFALHRFTTERPCQAGITHRASRRYQSLDGHLPDSELLFEEFSFAAWDGAAGMTAIMLGNRKRNSGSAETSPE